jgi:predicted negative regulator of RcsB-dependent stress response
LAYDTDEEQIEALKRWWDENGTTIIVGIVLVLAVLFGTRYWDSSRLSVAEGASDIFMQLLDQVQNDADLEVDDAELASAQVLHNQLKDEFDSSIYSRYSALMMARLYVQNGDLAGAAAELNWILNNRKLGIFQSIPEELSLTARSRLARVVLSQGDAQAALNLLSAVEAGAFAGNFAEIQGDAYSALGRAEEARQAYQQALDLGVNAEIVELKLNDISS